uniref:Nudix hydrolase domain-containing protein n=1 Tax=Equus caballus TaxID=9796 RepID=A0A3Q2H7D5_HORSE
MMNPYPDQWIVPGGGGEPDEEPGGKLGRLLGIFENQDRKHRTYVYVLTVTEILEDWEDSVNRGRKREWFKVEDAIKVLQCHKPVHAEYLEKLKLRCSPSNDNSTVPSPPDNNTLFVTAAQTPGLPSSIIQRELGEHLPDHVPPHWERLLYFPWQTSE